MSGLPRQHMSGLSRQHMSGLSRQHMSGLSRQHMSGLSDHFLVMSGSLFREVWDMLGDAWAYSGVVFGWIWDGFGKKFDEVENMKFSNVSGSIFPALGCS